MRGSLKAIAAIMSGSVLRYKTFKCLGVRFDIIISIVTSYVAIDNE
ncbi:MAG: hypothetical protein ACJAR6_001442 [Oleispira sp.]